MYIDTFCAKMENPVCSSIFVLHLTSNVSNIKTLCSAQNIANYHRSKKQRDPTNISPADNNTNFPRCCYHYVVVGEKKKTLPTIRGVIRNQVGWGGVGGQQTEKKCPLPPPKFCYSIQVTNRPKIRKISIILPICPVLPSCPFFYHMYYQKSVAGGENLPK